MFLRSLIAFGMVTDVANKTKLTRRDIGLGADVADGLVTFLYLLVMCWMARMAASPFDPQGGDSRLVASDVRRYVLRMLEGRTNGARTSALSFERVLREVEVKIDELLAEGPFSQHLDVDATYKRNAVLGCIDQMRNEFGGYGGDAEFTPRRPSPFDFTAQFSMGHRSAKSHVAASSVTLIDPPSRAAPVALGTRPVHMGTTPTAPTPSMSVNASVPRPSTTDNGSRNPPPHSTNAGTGTRSGHPWSQASQQGSDRQNSGFPSTTRAYSPFRSEIRSARTPTSTAPFGNMSSSRPRSPVLHSQSNVALESPVFPLQGPDENGVHGYVREGHPPPPLVPAMETYSIGGYSLPVARPVELRLDEDAEGSRR